MSEDETRVMITRVFKNGLVIDYLYYGTEQEQVIRVGENNVIFFLEEGVKDEIKRS